MYFLVCVFESSTTPSAEATYYCSWGADEPTFHAVVLHELVLEKCSPPARCAPPCRASRRASKQSRGHTHPRPLHCGAARTRRRAGAARGRGRGRGRRGRGGHRWALRGRREGSAAGAASSHVPPPLPARFFFCSLTHRSARSCWPRSAASRRCAWRTPRRARAASQPKRRRAFLSWARSS